MPGKLGDGNLIEDPLFPTKRRGPDSLLRAAMPITVLTLREKQTVEEGPKYRDLPQGSLRDIEVDSDVAASTVSPVSVFFMRGFEEDERLLNGLVGSPDTETSVIAGAHTVSKLLIWA